MKLNNQILMSAICIILILLSGCAEYRAKPLNRLSKEIPSANTWSQSIALAYHVFNASDCMKYLDRNVISKGYQPIHITLTNNSSHSLNFSLHNFSLPCIPPEEVAQKVYTDTLARAVGYGVTSIFLWPFIVPAIIDSIGSQKANEQLDVDFANKTLRNQTIRPFSIVNGLLFVPTEELNSEFSITLTDILTDELLTLTTSKTRIKNINYSYVLASSNNVFLSRS